MKVLLWGLYGLLLFTGCRKVDQSAFTYKERVQETLRDRTAAPLYERLDWAQARAFQIDSPALHLVQIPLQGEPRAYVLARTDERGTLLEGKVIQWYEQQLKDKKDAKGWNGRVRISTLSGTVLFESDVVEGYLTKEHSEEGIATKATVLPQTKTLPEIIVVSTPTKYGISSSDWIAIGGSIGYGGSSTYAPATGSSGGSSTSSGSGSGGNIGGVRDGSGVGGGFWEGETMEVDIEEQDLNAGIDIEKFLKCFNLISDVGASCSIEIMTDIPVDNDPNKIFDFNTLAPGHTFIQIKKSNGGQSVLRNIGFYPDQRTKPVMTDAPVKGKFVDNGGHEFNASFKMELTPAGLKSVLVEIQYLARFIKYDIDEYNCTDFALDVFNKTRANKLDIPMYQIPGSLAAGGSRTPNGLYNKLMELKKQNGTEAVNIQVSKYKSWVAYSSGTCN